MITITPEEFRKYTGLDLGVELPDFDDGSNKVTRAISLWTRRVYREVQLNSTRPIPSDDKLTDFQIESIKEAIIEYGLYYLKNGDLYLQSGFDEDKGKLVDPVDLARIRFPIICLDLLRRAGLIRKSFSSHLVFSQTHDNFYS